MSNSTKRSAVAKAFKELAVAVGAEVEDLQVKVGDDGFGSTVIEGAEVAEYAESAEEETRESAGESAGEDDDDGSDEDTREVVRSRLDEEDYKDLQKVASDKLEEYPEDSSREGLLEALTDAYMAEGEVESEDSEEPDVKHPDDAENPSRENYVAHFGECEAEGCEYGCQDEESERCVAHQTDDSPKADRELSDLSDAEAEKVEDLVQDEGKSLQEAISMV